MLHRVFAATACLAVLGVSACARPAEPPPSTPVTPPSGTPDAGVTAGPEGSFVPVSNTATAITGDVGISADGLLFGVGHVYATGPAQAVSATDLPEGLFPGIAGAATYTLRQVSEELVNTQAPNGGLCRPETTTWLLLGHDAATGTLALAAFSSADAPGADSSSCGTFSYAAG